MSVEEPRIFKRPIYAGNAIQTIKKFQMVKKYWQQLEQHLLKSLENANNANVIDTEMPLLKNSSHTRYGAFNLKKTERPDSKLHQQLFLADEVSVVLRTSNCFMN